MPLGRAEASGKDLARPHSPSTSSKRCPLGSKARGTASLASKSRAVGLTRFLHNRSHLLQGQGQGRWSVSSAAPSTPTPPRMVLGRAPPCLPAGLPFLSWLPAVHPSSSDALVLSLCGVVVLEVLTESGFVLPPAPHGEKQFVFTYNLVSEWCGRR